MDGRLPKQVSAMEHCIERRRFDRSQQAWGGPSALLSADWRSTEAQKAGSGTVSFAAATLIPTAVLTMACVGRAKNTCYWSG